MLFPEFAGFSDLDEATKKLAYEIALLGQASGRSPEEGVKACLFVVATVMVHSVVGEYGPYPQVRRMQDTLMEQTTETLWKVVQGGMGDLDEQIQRIVEQA